MAHWMLYLTPMAFLTGIYAAKYSLWVLSVAEWSLVVSSVFYWLNHHDGWRRNVDMIVVQLSLYTHLYYVVRYSSYNAFALYILAMSSYIVGCIYNTNFAHAFVWIFGCAANVVLVNDLCKKFAKKI